MGKITSYRKILCPAKVNLLLRIGPLRPDGFHDLETWMVKLGWGDRLSMRIQESRSLVIHLQSPSVTDQPEKNLVYRAAQAFSEKTGLKFQAQLDLQKNVPTGAGLGGGSSDAATTLELLARWALQEQGQQVSVSTLAEIALKLGSDVPFFLYENSSWCTGRGEVCTPASVKAWPVVLLLSTDSVATPWAYRSLDERRKRLRISGELSGAPKWMKDSSLLPRLENDFEPVVLELKPQLKKLKLALARSGASVAKMSGSGSTFFGIYENQTVAKRAFRQLKNQGFQAVLTELQPSP